MAVTVISRPLGHKVNNTVDYADIIDSSGDALATSLLHGLSDGQYIYSESTLESYSGFKGVEIIDFDTFYLLNEDGSRVQFKQLNTITFYLTDLTHGWQCVHLPIVYELSNDLYPANSVDPEVNFLFSFEKDGYLQIGHDALSGGDALQVLDYVKISNGGPTLYAQVIEVTSTILTVVNLPYFVATQTKVQKARNNYHIDINVYAGLPAGHTWESYKPYELATTLRFIPDSNNQIKFSIAEILKGYITTRNNLTLDTLPNNIDFFTSFYIEYAEGYDVSGGTEITAFLDEFTDDSEEFEGYAVNAMLAFKNLYSGFMSDYVDATYPGKLARWLTTMDVPIIFVGYFFDLSFINRHDEDIKINKNGVLYLTIPNPGIGVLRVPIEAQDGDTELCIQAWIGTGITVYNIDEFTGGEDWSIGGGASVTLDPLESSSTLSQAIVKAPGTYNITYTINVSGAGADGVFQIRFKKDGNTVGTFTDSATVGSPSGSGPITITDGADELTFVIINGDGSGSDTTYEFTSLTITGEDYITESICLRVVSECDTFIADDLRLIETGPFRELE